MVEELRQGCDFSFHNAARFGTVAGAEVGQLMAWFRTNRGAVAWLAFLALACQFALSFGHIHVSKVGIGWGAQAAAQTTDKAADAPPPSPNKEPAGLAGDFCAICANISLAALILPILALLLTPDLFTNILPWSLAARQPASFGHRPFSARGPPRG
jgi:hypothetical protein